MPTQNDWQRDYWENNEQPMSMVWGYCFINQIKQVYETLRIIMAIIKKMLPLKTNHVSYSWQDRIGRLY